MTPPIRWIESEVLLPTPYAGRVHKQPILQYQTASGEWVDVPVVGDGG